MGMGSSFNFKASRVSLTKVWATLGVERVCHFQSKSISWLSVNFWSCPGGRTQTQQRVHTRVFMNGWIVHFPMSIKRQMIYSFFPFVHPFLFKFWSSSRLIYWYMPLFFFFTANNACRILYIYSKHFIQDIWWNEF